MKRPLLYSIVAVVCLIIAGFFFLRPAPAVFGDEITLYVYTVEEKPTGAAAIAVPFIRNSVSRQWLNIILGDGEKNWLAENAPARVAGGSRNLLNFSLPENRSFRNGEAIPIALALTQVRLSEWDGTKPAKGAYLETTAKIEYYDVGKIIGMDIPGWGPEIYRGVLPGRSAIFPDVYAQEGAVIDVYTDLDLPDTGQMPAECAPTAASNAVTGLARAHNRGSDVPNARATIEELKRDMNFNNGVHGPENFIAGKNIFAEGHNLPIVTEQIESPTIQDIADAIGRGCAVEADLAFFESRNGRSVQVGNHMVSITGVYSDSETTALHGHDPATPEGVDLWRFAERDPWPLINYFSDRATAIKRIYTQCWLEEESSSRTGGGEGNEVGMVPGGSGGVNDGSSEVEMLVVEGSYFPAKQFKVAHPDACDAEHYHIEGRFAYGLEATDSLNVVSKADPNPGSCGFGRVAEVRKETIRISYEQGIELVKYLVD